VIGSALAAVAFVALLGAGAALARARVARRPGLGEAHVVWRDLLSRDAGVALVRARGRLLLVGWGRDGVRLVARIDERESR
jgi:hypothetical protein